MTEMNKNMIYDEDVAEFIKPGDLKRMAQWAKEAHELSIEQRGAGEMAAAAMRNAVWLETLRR